MPPTQYFITPFGSVPNAAKISNRKYIFQKISTVQRRLKTGQSWKMRD
jgi:hypothetical protein